MDVNDIFFRLECSKKLTEMETKYDYIIVKPNGAKYLKICLDILRWRGFKIIGIYGIKDFEKVNMKLHPLESEQEKIIPITKMFLDYFGNYGVVIIIGKKNITYEKFAEMVNNFKWFIRGMTATPYVTCILDQSVILNKEPNQEISIVDSEGEKISMYEMNNKGSFIVTMPNFIHTPDPSVESIIKELKILKELDVLDDSNKVDEKYLQKIFKYATMNVLVDMFKD